ncbi:hypothetical protein [Micromonospora sp. NPDC049679]|uniref:hypothetical protein n=1 Tax=Micromonospora sp. NPDC049679 TaxID=3155920 RepID=UPI0033C3957C
MLVGLSFGAAYAVARRAWRDYKSAQKAVPVARKAVWALIRVATTKGGVVLLLCAAAVGWAAIGDRP